MNSQGIVVLNDTPLPFEPEHLNLGQEWNKRKPKMHIFTVYCSPRFKIHLGLVLLAIPKSMTVCIILKIFGIGMCMNKLV